VDSRYILKVDFTGFADGLEVTSETRERTTMVSELWPEKLEGWSCCFLRWENV
jgi:hypothetical protein